MGLFVAVEALEMKFELTSSDSAACTLQRWESLIATLTHLVCILV